MKRTVYLRLLTLGAFLLPCLVRDGVTATRDTFLVKKDEKPEQTSRDWTNWRGPMQNGVALETDLPDKFSTDPKDPKSNLIWQSDIGSRSTPIIMGDHAYVISSTGEKENEQEQIVCFDADTGKDLWHYKFNVWLTQIVSDRVGWSDIDGDPETGNIYAQGTQGLLLCLNKDGKLVWQRSLTEEFGRTSGYGARYTSPIVDSGLVIIGMPNSSWGQYATGGIRFMAFDKKTGEVIWETPSLGGPPRTYASTPVIAVINGQRLVISGGGDGAIHALKVRTGEVVWRYQFANGGINGTPVVDGDFVYCTHGEPNFGTPDKGRVACLDASKLEKPAKPSDPPSPKVVWKVDDMRVKFSSPVVHDGRLYVCDETGEMTCMDAKTSDEIWTYRYGRDAKGSPVFADGKLYVSEVDGTFHILKPDKNKCVELYAHEFRGAKPGQTVSIVGSPAIVRGRVYFCTSNGTYCIGKKDHKAPPKDMPVVPKESAAAKDAKITHLQVVPAEVALVPGQTTLFKVRGFDADGHFIKDVEPTEWSLEAAPRPEGLPPPPPPKEGDPPPPVPPALKGEIKNGKFTVDEKLPVQMGTVVAKLDGIVGKARVRVVPKLPFAADFSKVPAGRTPAGWVNTQGKYEMRKVGDETVLVKKADSTVSSLARAYAYIGRPEMTDYTIQADILGKKPDKEELPDVGIVANRYVLMLMGATHTLRIASWEDKPRVDQAMDFKWKPDVWYRFKLTVQVKDGKAIVRGKVWERDNNEPKGWTIEYTDKTPNTEGAPALYAFNSALGMESYFNNVKITPNGK